MRDEQKWQLLKLCVNSLMSIYINNGLASQDKWDISSLDDRIAIHSFQIPDMKRP
jgi:hypothetical protein